MPSFNYTLTLSDAWSVVDIATSLTSTLTVPPNSSVAFPVGTVVWVTKRTGNSLTIAAGSGVTVNAVNGNLTTSVGAGLVLALVKVATDTWNVGLVPGDAATKNVGTTAGTVAAGDDSRLSDTRTPTDSSVTSAKIVDGAIVNADINASAAIDLSKLAAQADKTFVGNVSGGSAVPTAVTAANVIAALSGAAGASFSMNSQKITSLANGTATGNAATWDQTPAGIVTTKGDILSATGANAVQRNAVGADWTFIKADSTAGGGMSYDYPAQAIARPKTGSTVGYGIPNWCPTNSGTTALSPNNDIFEAFLVNRPITVANVSLVSTTNDSGKTTYVSLVALNSDLQPSGAVLAQSTLSMTTAGTLTWAANQSLTPGWWAVLYNTDSTATARYWYGYGPGFLHSTLGANGVNTLYKARTAGAFSGTPTWNTFSNLTLNGTGIGTWARFFAMTWTPT